MCTARAATGVSTTLRERIAALQQRGTSPLPTSPPRSKTPTGVSNANSNALRDKIARFEEKGGVPIPRGSFALGAPLQLGKPTHEILGNRIVSAGHLTSGRESPSLTRSSSLKSGNTRHSRSVSTSDPRLDDRYSSLRQDTTRASAHGGQEFGTERIDAVDAATPDFQDNTSSPLPSGSGITETIPVLIVEPSTPLVEQKVETEPPDDYPTGISFCTAPKAADLISANQLSEPTGSPTLSLSPASDQISEAEPVDMHNASHVPLPIILESAEADIVPVMITENAVPQIDVEVVHDHNLQIPSPGTAPSEDRHATEEAIPPALDESALISDGAVSATSSNTASQAKFEVDVPNVEEHAHGRAINMVVSSLNDATSSDMIDIPDETGVGAVSRNSELSSPAPGELKPVLNAPAPLTVDSQHDNRSFDTVQDRAVTETGSSSPSGCLEICEDSGEPTHSSSTRPLSTSTIYSESSLDPSVPHVMPILDAFPPVPGHVPPSAPTRAHTISGYRSSVNRTSSSSIKSTPSLTFSSASSSTGSPTSSNINAPQPPQRTRRPASSLQRTKSQSRPTSSVPFWYDDDSDDGEAGWATVVVKKQYY
ncbi:hypothetical protein BU17DRAFT_67239 [Hysterangium stoloniferum]|nr:hypothetical protein BU17DRAFT_67239 [Hysterangium stoloniferum]